jgi:hypothetical protein
VAEADQFAELSGLLLRGCGVHQVGKHEEDSLWRITVVRFRPAPILDAVYEGYIWCNSLKFKKAL